MNLYISDLDGTLLNNKAKLSLNSKDLINKVLAKNINFTIATARTPATVTTILKGLNLKLPLVVMNGCALYDISQNKYLFYNKLKPSLVKIINEKIDELKIHSFIYTITNDHLFVYYNNLEYNFQKEFYNQRKNSSLKTFVNEKLTNYDDVLYFVIIEYKPKVDALYEKIKNIKGITIIKYKDVYNKNCYILEIYDYRSSKANAIKYLQNEYKFNNIISFGDNYNDIPMFNISNSCYAVKNAVDSLKEIATGTIGLNTDDSVAKFLIENAK